MALRFWTGFEGIRDDNDLRAQGWVTRSTAINWTTLGVPSTTSLSGTGLKLMGPYVTNTGYPNVNNANGLTNTDHGMVDTGISVNSAWAAGGLTLGISGKFNSTNQNQIGCQSINQVVYDGAQFYWGIMLTGTATYSVVFSTDCVTWTQTATAPPASVIGSANSKITIVGSGTSATIIVSCGSAISGSNTVSCQFSTNFGLTWSSQPSLNTAQGNGVTQVIPTGNATTPWAMGNYSTATAGNSGIYTTTALGVLHTQVVPTALGTINVMRTLPTLGLIYSIVVGAGLLYVAQSSATLTSAASWVASSVATGMIDAAYFNGKWVAISGTGVATAPPASTSPVTGPTAAWTAVFSSAGMKAVAVSSSLMVAVGYDPTTTSIGAIWTSPDGVTWTKQNHLIRGGTATVGFNGVFYDGTRFVIVGGPNNNVLATSTDGFQWNATYYPDYTEAADTSGPIGVYAGTLIGGTNAYSPANNGPSAVVVSVGAASGGLRTVSYGTLTTNTTSGAATFGALGSTALSTTAKLNYFYELQLVATSTVNQFTASLSVDGSQVATSATVIQLAPTTDTTGANHILVHSGRSGTITQIDDLYVLDASGTIFNGPLGIINIIPNTPVSDSQAQWTRGGSQASNAAAVGTNSLTNALSAQTNQFVSTFTDGAKDIYTMSNGIPSNFKAKAILAEGYFERNGNTAPNVTIGIVSGAAEVDSAQVNITSVTPTYVSTFTVNDPNTGLPWTNAGAAAAKISITKVN
jgi:hypothetical protein